MYKTLFYFLQTFFIFSVFICKLYFFFSLYNAPHIELSSWVSLSTKLFYTFSIHQFIIFLNLFFLFSFLFLFFIFIYQLEVNYLTILQWFLSYIDMNQPWIYMYSPSRSPLPPPSPPDPSGSSLCTRSEHLSHSSNLGW